MMKRIVVALAGFGVLGAVLVGVLAAVSPASAAPPAQTSAAPAAQAATPSAQATPVAPAVGSVVWTSGQITAVQGNGFTMQGRNQQVTTVTVDANTWIVVPKNNAPAQGAIADLTVGTTVAVGGVASGTNAIAARVVQAGGAGPAFGGHMGPGGMGGP